MKRRTFLASGAALAVTPLLPVTKPTSFVAATDAALATSAEVYPWIAAGEEALSKYLVLGGWTATFFKDGTVKTVAIDQSEIYL